MANGESKSAIIPAYRHDILLSANYAEYGKSTVFRTLVCIKKFHYQNFPLKEKKPPESLRRSL